MIVIFIGPPFAGKDTQAKLLSEELQIPVFSMGAVIREAYENKDPRAIDGFENYSLKGQHVPIELKFDLLRSKIDNLSDFMLDNFPATQEDVSAFEVYLDQRKLKVNKVIYLKITQSEMMDRIVHRGRSDDHPEIIEKRRFVQDQDREPVLEYFRKRGLLAEIDGSRTIEEVHESVMKALND